MKFCEAMEKLKTGSKVSRHPWKDGVYFSIVNNQVKSFQPKLAPFIYNEEIMVSTGWFIDDQEKEYSFCDIIMPLIQGAKARFKEWNTDFIYLDKATKALVIHSMDEFPFIPDFESFVAQDWTVLE